jgi:hypothetical protein
MSIQLWYPTESPTSVLTLRSPEFGDAERSSYGNVFGTNRNNQLRNVYNAGQPALRVFEWRITALSLEERNELEAFLILSAGQLIGIKDYNDNLFSVFVTNEDIEFITIRDLCSYEATLQFSTSDVFPTPPPPPPPDAPVVPPGTVMNFSDNFSYEPGVVGDYNSQKVGGNNWAARWADTDYLEIVDGKLRVTLPHTPGGIGYLVNPNYKISTRTRNWNTEVGVNVLQWGADLPSSVQNGAGLYVTEGSDTCRLMLYRRSGSDVYLVRGTSGGSSYYGRTGDSHTLRMTSGISTFTCEFFSDDTLLSTRSTAYTEESAWFYIFCNSGMQQDMVVEFDNLNVTRNDLVTPITFTTV